MYAKDLADGNISGEAAYIAAYGIYLMNGGRPDDFLDFDEDDVQILFTTHIGLMRRQADMIARRIWRSLEE